MQQQVLALYKETESRKNNIDAYIDQEVARKAGILKENYIHICGHAGSDRSMHRDNMFNNALKGVRNAYLLRGRAGKLQNEQP